MFTKKDKKGSIIERIYIQYKNLMYVVAYNIVQDSAVSEDMVQESIIKVLRNLDKLDSDICSIRVKYFIVTIVKNTCLDYLARKKIIQFLQIDDFDVELQDKSINIDELIISNETIEEISRAIDRLDEKYSTVLKSRYFLELSYEQIADLLGITQETARARLHRGRKQLIEQLSKEGARIGKY